MASTLLKVLYVVAWLILAAVVPVLVLVVLRVDLGSSSGADTSMFVVPMLWLVCVGLTARWFGQAISEIPDGPVFAPVVHPLPHLPRPLVPLVAEAAAIQRDLDGCRLEPVLVRAWELANSVDALPPDLRFALEQTGATLAPVRELIVLRAGGSRVPRARQLAHLDAALAAFVRATVTPTGAGFRGGATPRGG
jgi:hypothetical protein